MYLDTKSVTWVATIIILTAFSSVQAASSDKKTSNTATKKKTSIYKSNVNYLSRRYERNGNVSEKTTGVIDCLIEPFEVVELATDTQGIVKKILVKRGDRVRRGQIVARLESEIEKVNVELSKARWAYSDKKFLRVKEVFAKKSISPQARDQAEAEKQIAGFEMKRSIELLKQRKIRSTIDGVVVERYVAPGEFTDKQKIIKVAQIDPLKVQVIVPIRMFGKIKKGSKADVYPEGPVKGPIKASVKIIDQVIDAASGTFGVLLVMPNPKHRIPAGLKCQVEFK